MGAGASLSLDSNLKEGRGSYTAAGTGTDMGTCTETDTDDLIGKEQRDESLSFDNTQNLILVIMKLHLKKRKLVKALKYFTTDELTFLELKTAVDATLACKFPNNEKDDDTILKSLYEKSCHSPHLGDFLTNLSFCKWSLKKLNGETTCSINSKLIIRNIWLNFSDCSKIFAKKLGKSNVFVLLMSDLASYSPDNGDDELYVITMGTILNLAKHRCNTRLFSQMKLHEFLLKLLKDGLSQQLKRIVLVTLPLINDGTDNLKYINENDIKDLLDLTRNTWENNERQHDGFSFSEMMKTLSGFRFSKKIRKMFFRNEILELLKDILSNENLEDTLLGAKLMRDLAPYPDAKNKIKQNEELVKVIKRIKGTKDRRIAKLLSEVLSFIADIEDTEEGADIFISYNYKDITLVEKICNTLKQKKVNILSNNIDVFMPYKSIEKAKYVLICMSESYNNSRHCQREAEYAFVLEKTIILLQVQNFFRPTGWINHIFGHNNSIHDFTDADHFDEIMDQLIKRLQDK